MGELVSKQYLLATESYRTVTLPGTEISRIPVFGKTGSAFTPGSPSTAGIKSGVYTYATRFRKGTPSSYTTPYITAINAPFIEPAYDNLTRFYSESKNLYTRNKVYITYGFVAGKGGNGGNGNQNWASWDRGSGGGGGGCVLFWLITRNAPSITNHTSGSTAKLSIGGLWQYYTLEATGGGNGGGKHSAGGGGGASVYTQNQTFAEVGAGQGAQYSVSGYLGALGVYLKGGQTGGEGQGWNGQTLPGDYNFTLPNELKTFFGISDNVSWNRNDGQGGACIAPGVNENGGTTWYGSGGHSGSGGNGGRTDGQGAGARWWTIEVFE